MVRLLATSTTQAPRIFAPVWCPHCASLGRSIPLYRQDQYGSVYIEGETRMEYAPETRILKVTCRCCHRESRFSL